MISLQGLTAEEAKKRLAEYGQNSIKAVAINSPLMIFIRQIRSNFIIYLLFAAMLISFFVGKNLTAYVILAVVILVVVTGFIQEYKAEKAIEALKKMITPISLVIRDGRELEVPTETLVPGDVIVLKTGEKVPADCLILEEKKLFVNEAVLTGEAKEIQKKAPEKIDDYHDENQLFMGSFVVGGKSTAQILHTGMNTRFGKIAGLISASEKEYPLQNKVNKIAKYMAIVGVLVSLLTGLLIILRSEQISAELITNILILVIALSVSAFPESFPVVLTTALSVGQFRMAKKNAIVNRMSVIETLGETTVVCADKTGTITKGEMTVNKIFTSGKFYDVTGVGYAAKGKFLEENKGKAVEIKNISLNLLKAAVLCNDANIKKNDKNNLYSTTGSPTESALLILAAKANIFKEDFKVERLEEIPFSSEKKLMAVLCREDEQSGLSVYAKGALEMILEKCTFMQNIDGIKAVDVEDKKNIISASLRMSAEGLRIISLAYKPTDENALALDSGLIFLGLLGITDAPREDVYEALALCRQAGIKVKMITGDNKETAVSIAKKINLGAEKVLVGTELDELSDDELAAIVQDITIFARVRPEHKLKIVRALKIKGDIVTMTGDGVNDAPALKEAHIGVAMGINGTDVSRSAADIILKDDNFATIIEAIKEGRTIFNNLRKFVTYQLSCNFAELLILFIGVLLAPSLGWAVPLLLAIHILYMNLVTDSFPAMTLVFNPTSEDLMKEKPRLKTEILNSKLITLLIFTGSLMAIFTLLGYYISFNLLGQSTEVARSTALLALIILELAAAFNYRSFRKPTLNRSPLVNKSLFYTSVASILVTLFIFYSPLRIAFETWPLNLGGWLIALGCSLVFLLLFDLLKLLNKKFNFFDLS